MTLSIPLSTTDKKLDPAATAMWKAHPDGPPADVYEPLECDCKILLRMTALNALGSAAAVITFPRLFPDSREARPC